jgi:hypothetical protein
MLLENAPQAQDDLRFLGGCFGSVPGPAEKIFD